MKLLLPAVIAAFILVGCDRQKAAIEDNKEAAKIANDDQKKADARAAPENTMVDAEKKQANGCQQA